MPQSRKLLPPVLVLLAALLLAIPPAAAERFRGDTTHVVAVEVPVQVIQGGEPVRGLTAANFAVFEGRKKLKVTSFEAVDWSAGAGSGNASPVAAPVAARRHFLLLFDLTYAAPQAVLKARTAAAQVVATALQPADLVAVATYSATQGAQVTLGFTADRGQIAAAIRTLGVVQPLERSSVTDSLHLVVTDVESAQFRVPVATTSNPRREESNAADIDSFLLEELRAREALSAADEQQNQVNRVTDFASSLSELAKLMASVQGRKYVVFLSEGFDDALLTGSDEAAKETPPAEQNRGRVESDSFTAPPSETRFGSGRTLNRLESMLDQFRRADCVVQAVDIGGLRPQGDLGTARAKGTQVLLSMAKETGGELYENWNDLGAAMAQMLKRTSVTYLLTLEPEDLALDGAYHPLKVELLNGPRGARVVARPGYYAPRPFTQQNPLERIFEAADSIVGGVESGTLQVAVLAAPFALPGTPKIYLPLVVDVDGSTLLDRLTGNVVPVEIYVYAFDAEGAVRDFLTQKMAFNLSQAPQLQAAGLKFFAHLDLAPGSYSVRVLVRNAKTGAYRLRVLPLEVPDLAAAGAPPYLLPPLFADLASRWLMTREAARGEERNLPYPFESQHKSFLPAARPVIVPGEEAEVTLVAYHLGEGEVQAAARVLAADGREIPGAKVKILSRQRGEAVGDPLGGPDRLRASLALPVLSPGEYRLQWTVTPAGGAPLTQTIAFVAAAPDPLR